MIYVPPRVSESLRIVRKRLISLDRKDFVNPQLYLPSHHLLKMGGKYLRPALVLLSAHSIGADPMDYTDLAAAAELLHTSSLIHDDIIDRDRRRRGAPAVHAKYGTEAAILSGDALISKAIQLSSSYGKKVMDSMAKAALEMCAGEILDYSFQKKRGVPKISEYTEIAKLKSASLIGASCASVPIHMNSRCAGEFYSFGLNFGIAFQIKDDISDYRKAIASKDSKPNIVITIAKQYGVVPKEAAEQAEKLKAGYVKKGLEGLKPGNTRELFSRYSELLSSY